MNVLVVGATGRTGRHVVQEAIEAGHTVRAFARSVRADGVPAGVEAMAGDVCEPNAVRNAVHGMDAVVVALSMVRTSDNPWARITTPRDLHTRAATHLLSACTDAGVQRYLTISAHGVGSSRARAGWGFLQLVHSSNIGVAYNNLADAERLVAASTLSWTIVRPTRLTNAAAAGTVRAAHDLKTTSWDRIARADLAQFLVQALDDNTWSRQAVSLTGT